MTGQGAREIQKKSYMGYIYKIVIKKKTFFICKGGYQMSFKSLMVKTNILREVKLSIRKVLPKFKLTSSRFAVNLTKDYL